VATEAARYLAKARESLASAEADLVAGRHNSAANRAYYAAFQAAVAALVRADIKPKTGNWQHRFVLSQFSGKLVRRRKLLSAVLRRHFDDLFRTRIVADYEPDKVSARTAGRSHRAAKQFVAEVEAMIDTKMFREASARYESEFRDAQANLDNAEVLIHELQETIVNVAPSAKISLIRLGPTDYRMHAVVETEDEEDAVRDALGSRTTDILVEHDVWIVVLVTAQCGDSA
jgi:uncharacterized protein (UPF0332 family)